MASSLQLLPTINEQLCFESVAPSWSISDAIEQMSGIKKLSLLHFDNERSFAPLGVFSNAKFSLETLVICDSYVVSNEGQFIANLINNANVA